MSYSPLAARRYSRWQTRKRTFDLDSSPPSLSKKRLKFGLQVLGEEKTVEGDSSDKRSQSKEAGEGKDATRVDSSVSQHTLVDVPVTESKRQRLSLRSSHENHSAEKSASATSNSKTKQSDVDLLADVRKCAVAQNGCDGVVDNLSKEVDKDTSSHSVSYLNGGESSSVVALEAGNSFNISVELKNIVDGTTRQASGSLSGIRAGLKSTISESSQNMSLSNQQDDDGDACSESNSIPGDRLETSTFKRPESVDDGKVGGNKQSGRGFNPTSDSKSCLESIDKFSCDNSKVCEDAKGSVSEGKNESTSPLTTSPDGPEIGGGRSGGNNASSLCEVPGELDVRAAAMALEAGGDQMVTSPSPNTAGDVSVNIEQQNGNHSPQTNMSSSQTNMSSPQTNMSSSQTNMSSSQTNMSSSQTNMSSSQTNMSSSQTNTSLSRRTHLRDRGTMKRRTGDQYPAMFLSPGLRKSLSSKAKTILSSTNGSAVNESKSTSGDKLEESASKVSKRKSVNSQNMGNKKGEKHFNPTTKSKSESKSSLESTDETSGDKSMAWRSRKKVKESHTDIVPPNKSAGKKSKSSPNLMAPNVEETKRKADTRITRQQNKGSDSFIQSSSNGDRVQFPSSSSKSFQKLSATKDGKTSMSSVASDVSPIQGKKSKLKSPDSAKQRYRKSVGGECGTRGKDSPSSGTDGLSVSEKIVSDESETSGVQGKLKRKVSSKSSVVMKGNGRKASAVVTKKLGNEISVVSPPPDKIGAIGGEGRRDSLSLYQSIRGRRVVKKPLNQYPAEFLSSQQKRSLSAKAKKILSIASNANRSGLNGSKSMSHDKTDTLTAGSTERGSEKVVKVCSPTKQKSLSRSNLEPKANISGQNSSMNTGTGKSKKSISNKSPVAARTKKTLLPNRVPSGILTDKPKDVQDPQSKVKQSKRKMRKYSLPRKQRKGIPVALLQPAEDVPFFNNGRISRSPVLAGSDVEFEAGRRQKNDARTTAKARLTQESAVGSGKSPQPLDNTTIGVKKVWRKRKLQFSTDPETVTSQMTRAGKRGKLSGGGNSSHSQPSVQCNLSKATEKKSKHRPTPGNTKANRFFKSKNDSKTGDFSPSGGKFGRNHNQTFRSRLKSLNPMDDSQTENVITDWMSAFKDLVGRLGSS